MRVSLGPKFTRLDRAGFDRSLSFLAVENNEMVPDAALALAHEWIMPRDAELFDGTFLKGIF